MSHLFLLGAIGAAVWAAIAYALANGHPDPSRTSLIPRVFGAGLLSAVLFIAAAIAAIAGAAS